MPYLSLYYMLLCMLCMHAVVYPGVDVVEVPEQQGGEQEQQEQEQEGDAVVRASGNVVAAFDWALRSRWEVSLRIYI